MSLHFQIIVFGMPAYFRDNFPNGFTKFVKGITPNIVHFNPYVGIFEIFKITFILGVSIGEQFISDTMFCNNFFRSHIRMNN